MTIPVPGAPLNLSEEAAVVGLSFLDAALRQNHIRRLTERLKLIEHGAARRVTEVDLSLAMLTQDQIDASSLFRQLRQRGEPQPDSSLSPSELWVPVARISRRSVSPIEVIDENGNKLPRVTQYETSRLLAAALYQLLKSILKSHPQARVDSPLSQFLYRVDESRWLLQSSISTLLQEKSRPQSDYSPPLTAGTVPGHGAKYRQFALDILTDYATELREFVALLDVAVREYILVVSADSTKDEHLLQYESPLEIFTKGNSLERKLRDGFREELKKSSQYNIEYHTQVPSTLRSYHLVAEVADDVTIAGMTLTTTADQSRALGVRDDLSFLSARIDAYAKEAKQGVNGTILELELQSTLRSASELIRRRRWEASESPLAIDEESIKNISALSHAAIAGEATVSVDDGKRSSLLYHPNVTSAALSQAAEEIEEKRLGTDFAMENDPAQSAAHVYWRRSGLGTTLPESLIAITSGIVIQPTGPTRPRGVIRYILVVAAMSYLVGSLLCGAPLPFQMANANATPTADAIVAVLLLVPGFLYTRLDLPASNSISGRVRSRPRLAAYASIGMATLDAVCVATGVNGLALSAVFSLSTMFLLLLARWLYLRGLPETRGLVFPRGTLPPWLAVSPELDATGDSDMTLQSYRSESVSSTVPPGDLADLARGGLQLIRGPHMSVDYVVHHIADRPGYLMEKFSGDDEESSQPTTRETLSSSAYGFGVVVGTSARRPSIVDVPMPVSGSVTTDYSMQSTADGIVYRGQAWPNPSFIYEAAKTLEGIISIEIEPWTLQYRHGLAIRAALEKISGAASRTIQAPLMALQSPVQIPPHHFVDQEDVTIRRDEWSRSSSLAIRFSVALKNSNSETRVTITDELVKFCVESGFGLWIGDSRTGYGPGNWFHILEHDKTTARSLFSTVADRPGQSHIACALPISLVGPARIGSTHAVIHYLCESRELGVLSCSVTALDDLAFINLLLPVNGLRPSKLKGFNERIARIVNNARDKEEGALTPQTALPALLPELLRGNFVNPSLDARMQLEARAGDYQVLVGSARTLRVPPRSDARVPIWASWQVEGEAADVGRPIRALYEALRAVGLYSVSTEENSDVAATSANIEYMVCRDLGGVVLRGRGKLSIPRSTAHLLARDSGLESLEAKICSSIQQHWGAKLVEAPFLVRHLAIGSRENRLGQRGRYAGP